MQQRILIVGAGAVGQVYALHLQRGGAAVSLFVKPKYVSEVRAGLTLYPLSGKHKNQQLKLSGCPVLCEVGEVASQSWDQVWLCVSTTALDGSWLYPLLGAIGKATVVVLQPGPEVRGKILQRLAPEQLVTGLITLISFQTPLPGERRAPPGVAYYFPPLSAAPFSGAPQRASAVVDALKKGGCPARLVRDADAAGALGAALFQPIVAGLEAQGWSFHDFGRSDTRTLVCKAAAEAADSVGMLSPLVRHFVKPWLIRLLAIVAPRIMPFDLEIYMRYHFTKVGDQTRALLSQYSALAAQHGQAHEALDTLLRTLPAVPDGRAQGALKSSLRTS